MDAKVEIDRILTENRAVLVRNKKHQVWRLPNGRNFIRTRSTHTNFVRQLGDLRRALRQPGREGNVSH